MGGGSTKDRMGIPHHAPIFYHGDAFQFGVRVGCDDPSRNTRKLATFSKLCGGGINEERRVNLDLLDEARIKAQAVKRRVKRQYSSKIKPRQFQIGDLVMRKAHPYELENNLSPKWIGPFRVT